MLSAMQRAIVVADYISGVSIPGHQLTNPAGAERSFAHKSFLDSNPTIAIKNQDRTVFFGFWCA